MPTRILIADDSPSVCRLLAAHVRSAADLTVVGTAHTGEEAIELNDRLRPDAVTLDLGMPGMGGLAALGEVMRRHPVPVLLLSGIGRAAADLTVQALAAGAVDFLPKYTPGQDTDPLEFRQLLVAKLRAVAAVKVIRSLPTSTAATGPRYVFGKPSVDLLTTPLPPLGPYPLGGVVVIGASTGGPVAVRELLMNLSTDYPAAVLVVQHMPATFTRVFAEQLDRATPIPVKEAADGDRLRPGFAYVAPGDRHTAVRSDGRLAVTTGERIGGHRPSIDRAMESAAEVYGPRAVGVVLTGMGEDGARGLAAIRAAGGRTFAQDEESCTVYGMPGKAVELAAAETVASPGQIGEHLIALVRDRQPKVTAW